jgi:epoxide hydrolase-like predicted phosphatase
MTRPPALIFDFGNVVAHFDYHLSADRFGRLLEIPGQDFLKLALDGGFTDLLKLYESGQLSSSEFHDRFCRLTELTIGFDDFAKAWVDIFRANESVHRLIEELKTEGYALILGSNTNELHSGHFREQFRGILDLFDALVLSFEVGQIKPDAAFYGACSTAAGRPPAECVFIDDLVENIDGARRAGLMGIVYTDTPRLIEDLKSIGVSVRATRGF